jgi:hypothetical protein
MRQVARLVQSLCAVRVVTGPTVNKSLSKRQRECMTMRHHERRTLPNKTFERIAYTGGSRSTSR